MLVRTGWLRAWIALAGVLAGALGWVAPLPASAEEPARVLLLLDVSGSMNEQISSGGTKFAAAQRALKQVADALPAGTQVGLRVYGSEIAEPREQNPKACTDTELVLPVSPLDRDRMYRAVDSFTAVGETPIAYSLEKSVADLGESGRRVLVLISDGEESCAGDPCPTARKLARSGVDLQFNAVGLDVGAKARQQLECIAEAGEGSYYDADKADDLSEAVRKLTQRALRPFAISGTPVEGTEDPTGAPALAVGQYRDRYDTSETPRYYQIPQAPGHTVTASITSLVPPTGGQNIENWTMALTSASGESCDAATLSLQSFRSILVVSGAVRSDAAQTEACAREPLVLALQRKSLLGNKRSAPVEILVRAEPPILNLASLPEGVTSYDGKAAGVDATKPRRRVVGGTSFTDAATLRPGSWSDAPTVGETVFYRVRLEPGQRLRVSVKAPAPRGSFDLDAADVITPALLLFAPSRARLARQPGQIQGDGSASFRLASPEVRVRNREVGTSPDTGDAGLDSASMASVAGDYFVAFEAQPLQAPLTGRVLPISLNVAVDGRPEGQPAYAVPSPTPAPSSPPGSPADPPADPSATPSAPATPETEPTGGSAGWPVVLGGGLLAIAAVVAAFWLGRRRSSPS